MDQKIDSMMEASQYSWREILDTVLEGMNPWDIDIIELASRYSKRVDEMMDLNFRLPANVVLVSSVLLRMKSDMLAPIEVSDPYHLKDQMYFIFDSDYPFDAIMAGDEDSDPYPLTPNPVRMMTRRVTAAELIDALQGVLKENEKRSQKIQTALSGEELISRDMVVKQEKSIIELIEETYHRVVQLLIGKEKVLLTEIVKSTEELMETFLVLLHLANERKLTLSQEQLYGDVYINTS